LAFREKNWLETIFQNGDFVWRFFHKEKKVEKKDNTLKKMVEWLISTKLLSTEIS